MSRAARGVRASIEVRAEPRPSCRRHERGEARTDAVAIVPAAGSGARLGTRVPKQYLALAGAPLLVHTLRVLARARALDTIVVAAPAARVGATRALLRRYRLPPRITVVAGGATRQESVLAGLEATPPDAGLVLVHDAVRPFIDTDLIDRVLAAAWRGGAATCGLPVRETVKRVRAQFEPSRGRAAAGTSAARRGPGQSEPSRGRPAAGASAPGRAPIGPIVEGTMDREGLWLVQTPQAFHRGLLWEAHDKARRDGFAGTDDAVLVERLGAQVAMVPGLPQNMKITTRMDLATARWWLGGARRGRVAARTRRAARRRRSSSSRGGAAATATRHGSLGSGRRRPGAR